ncbi:anaerobic glycerol-3-phosphate dehydrogenase subunit C [Halogeometricum borinquense]|uniref:Glycerol 3-phosphate dehydrogenase (Quinone) subunit C n=2 Tax=Halogeometricum borinquense TaxID=60847 RepID=E4NLQ4_HALBP|nr:anaerobic glycerol-3-phosphate dehydrogenase subunit C [Halogeometricum borinquense]ADQ67257.1 glycerol 3-phosphate dehydrogenase (quinone) subunit C [Halogeometricum borinquense DSM 11551]ELY28473.1 sn-glycerol-3-phosphate dehydrogenase subunit C [Halogeometricum borinquense DSM 11551]QIB74248.1 anaerobic glycerol-3-phosphate dehydrogenase subunit C [Halogeometricum borinquense]QIQ76542.1 anaerobic glycerol-3-phosphate dehydrogenase subunit C [Halogeometricum borinquense]RYJ13795.1 anaerob
MSDAENPPNVTPDEQTDFEPVQVFDDETEMDLRPGADNCYKCTSCDTSCPVAEVNDDFPGPKFQGPEQWRLKRKDDADIDDSIMSCSNCMRCDNACPSSVPLSQMHNTARGEYVDEQMDKLSREYIRNRILSNYRTMAEIGSKVPRLTNFLMGNSLVQKINEKVLGITSEREFPEFAQQTFREWWAERGGAKVSSDEKKIAYFHGCYSNYNTPEVAKALVRVYEEFGYEIAVPRQRCSGTPMFANGMLDDAGRAAKTNVSEFNDLLEEGYDIVASCTSCSMSLRQEYPELFEYHGTEEVAANTYEAMEYLRIHEDLESELKDASVSEQSFAYHAPCHARNQGLDRQAVELFRELDGVTIEDVGDSCSGISGTYGWKEEKYETSMKIGEEMFDHMSHAEGNVGMTECPTCSMQMEHGTGYDIKHPLQLLEEALV